MLAQKLRNGAKDSLSLLRSHTSITLGLKRCEMKACGFILLLIKQILEGEYTYLEALKVYSSNVNKTNASFQIKPIYFYLSFRKGSTSVTAFLILTNNCLDLFTVETTWNHLLSLQPIHFSLEFTQSKTTGVIHCDRLKTATNSLLVFTLKWSLISLPLNLGWPQWLSWQIKYSRNDLGFPKLSHKELCSFHQAYYYTLWEPWSTMSNDRLSRKSHAGDSTFCDSALRLMSQLSPVFWPSPPRWHSLGEAILDHRDQPPPSNLHQHHMNWALPGFLTLKIMRHKKMVVNLSHTKFWGSLLHSNR